jgi:DNA helicase HerA-like ATPase
MNEMSALYQTGVMIAPVVNLGELSFNLSGSPWNTQGFRCAVSGASGSGKSYLLAVLAEEVHQLGIGWAIVDPDGEHRALQDLAGVARVGVSGGDLDFRDSTWAQLAVRLVRMGGGVVVDFSELRNPDEWHRLYTWFAGEFFEAHRREARPCFLFIEEAHIFAPQKMRKGTAESLEITTQIARRGRKFGINTVFGSQRPADLEKDIISQANVRFFGRLELEHDYKAVQSYLPSAVRLRTLQQLDAGQFYMTLGGYFRQVRIRERATPDLGATPAVTYRQRNFLDVVDMLEVARNSKAPAAPSGY